MQHSGELSAAADRLQAEAQALTDHATEIGRPLQQYDAVDRMGVAVGVLFKGNSVVVRGLAKVKVDDEEEFAQVLQEIDEAVVFFGNESGGKLALQEELARRAKQSSSSSGQSDASTATNTSGNIEYFRRALALQEAALDLIKEAVAERIKTTSSQVTSALGNNFVVGADQLEASLVYTRFHGISNRSRRLLTLVRTRLAAQTGTVAAEAYTELLQHCVTTYCGQRESLLRPTVRHHMDELQKQHGAVGMTRLATVFLNRLCTVETSLYHDFFGEAASSSTTELNSTLMNLCATLHRTVRRSLVNTADLDVLCQIVSVLREEQKCAPSLQRVIGSSIQDAQERLIFCANTTLKKNVVLFQPSAADLAYPDKLKKKASTDGTVSAEEQLLQVYDSWFPPLRTVLKILSKIFRVVEPRVFEDMALSSVQSCTKSLQRAAGQIAAGQLDSDLFLVKHLLILREQLSPFDIELRSVERQLDFSDAGKAVARFLANQNRRVFSMSNALVTLLREGVSVSESAVDSKRDLEDALRTACNAFIDHTSRSIAGELLELVDGLKVVSTQEEPNALDDKVVKMMEKLAESVEEGMGKVTTQMALYLDNTATQGILLKPVSRKLTRAVEDVRKMPCSSEDIRSKVAELCRDIDQKIKASSLVRSST